MLDTIKARKAMGLTQKDFAEQIGISERQLQRIEAENKCDKRTELAIKKLIDDANDMALYDDEKIIKIVGVEVIEADDSPSDVVAIEFMFDGANFSLTGFLLDSEIDFESDDLLIEGFEEWEEKEIGALVCELVSESLEPQVSEDEVREKLKSKSLNLVGRDPYKNDMWHVTKNIDSSTTKTVGHFVSLKEIQHFLVTANG